MTGPSPVSEPAGRTDRTARWIYRGLWRVLVDWFRVPGDPPTLPVRAGDHLESFRPAPGFLRYLKLWFWIVCLIIDLALLIGYIIAAVALLAAELWWVALLLLPVALAIIFIPDLLAYIGVHLRYDTTWYVMTDRSLRIRRGIWTIHETTITFENVQNMKVQQGPVQRAFGISNLIVETAGGGGGGESSGQGAAVANRGIIEGVTDARRLREMILPRVRQSRSAGLGDEEDEDQARTGRAWTPDHLAVLREIRDDLAGLSGSV
ncbi:MAG: PH domain-containing protein [Planctomycetota bacterium]|nr:PH domain-containing protein [Planctomycetota bacterium]